MKILHCCLGCFYIDNYLYQENVLPYMNKLDGHEVQIVASTETFVDNNQLGYINPSSYINEYGIPVTRLPYSRLLPHFVMRKLRKYRGFQQYLEDFAPDVIFFHGLCSWALLTVARYKRDHPQVKFYADSHSSFDNSALGFVSRTLLHRIVYRFVNRRAYPYIDRIFYVATECRLFLTQLYGLPEDKMEFFPLGGTIPDDEEYQERRSRVRRKLGLQNEDVLIFHSGKLDPLKRTKELLSAFSSVSSDNLRLAIAGSLPPEGESVLSALIEADPRVTFVGWANSDTLTDFLCACDLYAQPGSQSATMQYALCCRAPVMLYPYMSHEPYLKGTGWFVETEQDMVHVLTDIAAHPEQLTAMSAASFALAQEILDYHKLAARLYR